MILHIFTFLKVKLSLILSNMTDQNSQELTTNDLPHVLITLNPVAAKCHNFGLFLGVPEPQIKIIEHNYSKCEDQLREIIVTRLNQESSLTWPFIVTALQNLGEHELVRKIQSKHMPSSQSTNLVQEQDRSIEPPTAKRPGITAVSDQSEVFIQFIDFVKTTYKGYKIERDPNVLKWPPTPSKVYINLACIDRKRVSGKSKKYKEVTEAMVRDGNVDVISGDKFPIDMDQIASGLPPNPLETVILVEGAPGVGKSTFAWEYCRRWERGEIAQQYQLVLLIRLRDDRNSNAKTLKDLIHHPLAEAVNNVLEATAGANTLIILEGFDELPDTCRSVNSVFMQLISGEILRLATVMVTSRPWATRGVRDSCHHRIFQHIEIMGFTSQQIASYIESALPASEARRGLKAYLDRHPQIRAGMYIPLNSAIVVTVYQESQDSECDMPTTLTELYTDLVKTLLVRYLRGHPGHETKYIQSFTDLPSDVYAKFLKLCKVAYNGIVNTSDQVQLIFSERDLPTDFDNLGFMDSVTELYVTKGTISSHNFLHLTFQEFFAAFHISTMSPEQQLKHFNDHKMQSDRVGGDSGRMNVVLRFVAGLTKLKCLSKESAIYFLYDFDEDIIDHIILPCDAGVDINLLNWMFETQSNDVIELLLEHKIIVFMCDYRLLPMDYYCLGYCIAHSQCQWVLCFDNEEMDEEMDEEMLSMLVAGVNTSPECNGTVVGLGGDISTTVDCLNMRFSGLKTNLRLLSMHLQGPCDSITWPDLSELQVLELFIADIEPTNRRLDTLLSKLSLESLTITGYDRILHYEDCVAITHHLNTTSTLKHINISEMKFSNVSGLLLLLKALQDHPTLQQKNIKNLHIIIDGDDEAKDWAQLYEEYSHVMSESDDTMKATGISDDGAVALSQVLHHNSTMQELDLSNNSISDAGAVALAQALHHNSTMQELDLSNNSISDAGAVALAQALHNSTMQKLDLSNNSISDDGAVALSQVLHHNSTMQELDLSNNSISDDGAVALAQVLHHNSTMQELDLSNNSISDDGAVALAQALHNSTMQKLDLSNNSISDDGAVALSQVLHHNSTMQELDLSNNSISDDGAVALAQVLHHNSTMQELDLSNNSISDDGAVALAQALHHNSTMQKLDLSNNSISDDGAVALAQALHHNSTMQKLDLSNNSISDDGAVALAQALHNSTMQKLDLSNNSISDDGAVALAQALHHNSTMRRLNLSNNSISDDGAVALAQALHNSTMQKLDLSNNSISDDGAVALAQALHNSTMQKLDLSNNSISDDGAVALSQTLHNSTMQELYLSNNSISDDGAVALAQTLHNSTMQELDLSNNSISDDGAVALAQALHHNSTMRRLNLSNNSISDAGAVAVAQTLHHNSTMQELYLSNNSISDDGAVALAQALHHNSTMRRLDLSNNSISDAGAVAVAQALHHNSTMRRLYLSNNSISDAGAVALAQALHHNSTLKCLWLHGNNAIGEEGTHALIEALTVNTSTTITMIYNLRTFFGLVLTIDSGLTLSTSCEQYATQCPQYDKVKNRITFYDDI